MKRAALGALVVTALLAGFGCSGGGGGSTSSTLPAAPASNKPATTKAEFHITIPLPQTGANAKRPAYVSPNTRSVSFSGSGITPQTIALVASGPGCPIDGSGTTYTCTAAFDAPIADINLQVSTFASTDGTGQALSENTIDQTIIGGQDNNINVTLNGIAATLFVNVTPNTTLTGGTPGSYTATWGAKDASGATIVGSGTIVDINNNANILAPTLTSSNPTDLTVGTQTGNSWAVAYDGTDLSAAPPTLTLAQSGYTSAVATFTANPTPTPTPTPTATPSPTPSPTPTPVQVILNGDFESSSTVVTSWLPCFTGTFAQTGGTGAGLAFTPADASPSPQPTAAATAAANPTNAPTASPSPGAVKIVQSVPAAALTEGGTPTSAPVHGGSNAAFIGQNDFTGPSSSGETKGIVGICQTVTVPASNPKLTLWIYEGGDSMSTNQTMHIGALYTGNPFAAYATAHPVAGVNAVTTTTAAWAHLFFAQNNCYHSSAAAGTLKPGCDPNSGSAVLPAPGGQWYKKGPYDLSTWAGQSVTIMLGQYAATAATTTYSYAVFDDVTVTGDGT